MEDVPGGWRTGCRLKARIYHFGGGDEGSRLLAMQAGRGKGMRRRRAAISCRGHMFVWQCLGCEVPGRRSRMSWADNLHRMLALVRGGNWL
jgi:hypothetical protein